ncbi:hypothetical protein [Variovorax sp. PAMC26660]|uniref:hypothetical protein n=1 Tax=Variovorax sp. PAMC26660 TaxID=2762322 RepID=UPI00164DC52E|nr:hypothetical protein [Variovorax sp. PAMC26660]QNK66593.1 hypothetical protein H7F35_25905 [Variovorax sp. PAMC26660]
MTLAMWIGLSREPSRESVERALARHLPGVSVWWGDLADPEFRGDITLAIEPNPSEFPFVINGWAIGGRDRYQYELGLRLARELCVDLDCSTICDGSHHGPTKSPYWSIVWQQGIPYLADDCRTLFADCQDDMLLEERQQLGPVRLLHVIEVELGPLI